MSENIIMLKAFLTAFSMILIVARYMLDDCSLIRITIESKTNRDITSYIIYAPRLNHQYFSVSLCMYAGFPVILGCL